MLDTPWLFPWITTWLQNDEVVHHGSLEERNAEMCFCGQVSPPIYTQKGYTRHRQFACSSENTSACAKSTPRCWASSLAWLGEGKSGSLDRLPRARGTREGMTCTPPWRGTLSGCSEKPLAQHTAELQHSNGACLGHRAGTLIKAKLSIEDRSPSTIHPSCCWPGVYRIHSLDIQTRKPVFCQNRHPDLARLGDEAPIVRATRLAAKGAR